MKYYHIWCASVAGDTMSYVVYGTEEDALATIPLFMRQDFEIRLATEEEVMEHK